MVGVFSHRSFAANEAHVKKLKITKKCNKCDLSSVNLNSARLIRARLRKLNLSKTKLRGAKLRRADIRNADLSRADLSRANLRSARLRKANLRKARQLRLNKIPTLYYNKPSFFQKIGLSTGILFSRYRPNLHRANFRGEDIRCADFREGRNVKTANFKGSKTKGAIGLPKDIKN
jgi:uncharacterized protein YjbI with pentapeptide repeats